MGRARFFGNFVHSVDTKGRVAVPVGYRKKLAPDEDTFVLVPGRDQAIEVRLVRDWEEYERQILENQPEYAPETLRSKRYLYSRSAEVSLDSQGRLLLPRHLLEEAEITTEAVIAGMGSFFELWNPERYRAFIAEERQRYDTDRNAAARHGWEAGRNRTNADDRNVPHSGDGR
ncbi:MAG: division/cell wall cluster transcriptional repressor MraZ [candidate division WOR-3 bacterium]